MSNPTPIHAADIPRTMNTQAAQQAAVPIKRLVPSGHITCLIGQIRCIHLGWTNRMQITLSTSIGDIETEANRDTFAPDLKVGTWIKVRLMRCYDREHPWMLGPVRVDLDTHTTTAWFPDTDCHRPAQLQRLRRLLGRLTPAMQAFFIAVLPDHRSQRRFFRRVAALDHHVYPGGLFDQSVNAAELAYASSLPGERERGIAALGALLFDIGKLADPSIRADFTREGSGLLAHPLNRMRILRACSAVEDLDPDLAETLRLLLTDYGQQLGLAAGPQGEEDLARLRDTVHRAVRQSWSDAPVGLRLTREPR